MVFEVVGIDDSGCCHVQVSCYFLYLFNGSFSIQKVQKGDFRIHFNGWFLNGKINFYWDNSFVSPLASFQHNGIWFLASDFISKTQFAVGLLCHFPLHVLVAVELSFFLFNFSAQPNDCFFFQCLRTNLFLSYQTTHLVDVLYLM